MLLHTLYSCQKSITVPCLRMIIFESGPISITFRIGGHPEFAATACAVDFVFDTVSPRIPCRSLRYGCPTRKRFNVPEVALRRFIPPYGRWGFPGSSIYLFLRTLFVFRLVGCATSIQIPEPDLSSSPSALGHCDHVDKSLKAGQYTGI